MNVTITTSTLTYNDDAVSEGRANFRVRSDDRSVSIHGRKTIAENSYDKLLDARALKQAVRDFISEHIEEMSFAIKEINFSHIVGDDGKLVLQNAKVIYEAEFTQGNDNFTVHGEPSLSAGEYEGNESVDALEEIVRQQIKDKITEGNLEE